MINSYPRTFDEDFCDKVTNLVDPSAGRVGAGILDDYGVASLSGYGDGQYNVFVAKMDDVVVSVCVVFIGDDDARP